MAAKSTESAKQITYLAGALKAPRITEAASWFAQPVRTIAAASIAATAMTMRGRRAVIMSAAPSVVRAAGRSSRDRPPR